MTLNVNFDKNRCTSVEKVNAYVLMNLKEVNKRAKIKHINVELWQRVQLTLQRGYSRAFEYVLLRTQLPGLEGGEESNLDYAATLDLA